MGGSWWKYSDLSGVFSYPCEFVFAILVLHMLCQSGLQGIRENGWGVSQEAVEWRLFIRKSVVGKDKWKYPCSCDINLHILFLSIWDLFYGELVFLFFQLEFEVLEKLVFDWKTERKQSAKISTEITKPNKWNLTLYQYIWIPDQNYTPYATLTVFQKQNQKTLAPQKNSEKGGGS